MKMFEILFKNGAKLDVSERVANIIARDTNESDQLLVKKRVGDEVAMDFFIDKSDISYIVFKGILKPKEKEEDRVIPEVPKEERSQIPEGVDDFPNDEYISEKDNIEPAK